MILDLGPRLLPAGVDELVCLAVAGSIEKKTVSQNIVQQINQTANIPLAVGGGISNVEQIERSFIMGSG